MMSVVLQTCLQLASGLLALSVSIWKLAVVQVGGSLPDDWLSQCTCCPVAPCTVLHHRLLPTMSLTCHK